MSRPFVGLKTRVLSAVIAIILFLVLAFYSNAYVFWCVGFLVFLKGAYEYYKLALSKLCPNNIFYNFIYALISILILLLLGSTTNEIIYITLLLTLFWCCCIAILRNSPLNEQLEILKTATLGIVYTSILPSFILKLVFKTDGYYWIGLLLVSVFMGDIFAYFGGLLFGKNKILPNVSPNKTIEGSLFGLLGSAVGFSIFSLVFLKLNFYWHMIVIGIFIGVFAQFGDFFESALKRIAGVKDSGTIMPGHGGVLDRLDGVYFAAPLIYFYHQLYY